MEIRRLIKNCSFLLLYLYIFSLYIFAYDPELNIISHVFYGGLLVLTLLYILLTRNIKLSPFYLFILLIYVESVMGVYWAIDPKVTSDKSTTIIFLFLIAFCIINVIETEKELENLIYAIFICGMVFAIYSVFFYGPQNIMNSIVTGIKLGGDINQENAFGLYNSITYTLGIYYGFKKNKLYFLVSFIPFILTISSGSRKSLLVLIAGTVFLIILMQKSKNMLKPLFTIGIISVILYFIISSGIFGDAFLRMEGLFSFLAGDEANIDSSTLTRSQMIEFGWNMFKKRPFTGYGLNQYNTLYMENFGTLRPSHNNYIQMLVDYGIIGFSIFYGMYFFLIKNLVKYLKTNTIAKILFILYVICLINDMTTNTILNKFTYIYLSLGFCFINLNKKTKIEDKIGTNCQIPQNAEKQKKYIIYK